MIGLSGGARLYVHFFPALKACALERGCQVTRIIIFLPYPPPRLIGPARLFGDTAYQPHPPPPAPQEPKMDILKENCEYSSLRPKPNPPAGCIDSELLSPSS